MISVIIPNYNQKQYISQAIQSALLQTKPADEIIVIDDGSTDESSEVIKGFGDRVRYIWQENKGLAGARNTGIQASTGEFIALLDADDEWLPNHLERMVAFADHNPDASVYYCRAQAIDEQGNKLPQIFGGPALPSEDLYQTLLRANFIIPSTVLIHKSVMLEMGLFDQNLRSCEDWDLWLRVLPKYPIIGIDDVLVRYRIHEKSLSANPAGMQTAAQAIIEKNFGMDDGQFSLWSANKRRAYGGLYRYYAITTIQRLGDWDAGVEHLLKAIYVDPTLSYDLNTFYEIILGTQPSGFRGTRHYVNFLDNKIFYAKLIKKLSHSTNPIGKKIRRLILGTANYATGLVAYNSGKRKLSRGYFLKALIFCPKLLSDPLISGNLMRSYFSEGMLERVKKILRVQE